MNRKCIPAFLLLASLLLGAAEYATQWPLRMAEQGAGAYRVTLPIAVYRTATDPALRDVTVLDAESNPVPSALQREPSGQAATRLANVPWFALPAQNASSQNHDLRVLSERDTNGRVLRVQVQSDLPAATAAPTAATSWLLDASAIAQPIQALQLRWHPPANPLEIRYRVEGSDDLNQWRVLQSDVRLMDLSRDGQRIVQARIPLDGSARYLRLLPVQPGAAPALQTVTAEWRDIAQDILQWETRQPARGDGLHYEFDSRARIPVTQVDVALPGNAAGSWRVESRDSMDAAWQWRAGPWTVFRVGDAERSAP